jgi:hypothetical protein
MLRADEADRRNEVTVVNAVTLVTRTFPIVPVNDCPHWTERRRQ